MAEPTMASGSTDFVLDLGASKIAYAPTDGCSSTTTQYDADLSQTLTDGEGVGTMSGLDAPADGKTVQEEIVSRGFMIPSLF